MTAYETEEYKLNYDEFYGEAYEVMKQAEMRLLQLIELYETEWISQLSCFVRNG